MQSGAQPSGNVDARHTADSTSRRWPAPRPPAPGVGALAHRDAYAPAARAQSQRAPSRALLDSLHQLTRTSQTLSGRLESGAARLLGALNTPEQVTRLEGLKRAVLNSGLFLEARLAGKSNEPALDLSRDFKAALLRLRAELAPQLPATQDTRLTDIATQVERTLARLDLSQLATVAADREHRPAWALELPLRTQDDQVDVARLNIQREDDAHGNDENAQRTYSAVLKLEPAGLGRVTAHITLVGDHVSVGFEVADPSIQARFEERLEALRTSLVERGLTATRLATSRAAPASGEDGYPAFTDTRV